MGADEANCADDENGHVALTVDMGGGVDLLLPLDPALGGGEVEAAEINEPLEVEIKAEELEGEDFGGDSEAKEGGEGLEEVRVTVRVTERVWRKCEK